MRMPNNGRRAAHFPDVFPNGDIAVLARGGTVDDTWSNIVAMLRWPQLMAAAAAEPEKK